MDTDDWAAEDATARPSSVGVLYSDGGNGGYARAKTSLAEAASAAMRDLGAKF